jgi:hypothetical protein
VPFAGVASGAGWGDNNAVGGEGVAQGRLRFGHEQPTPFSGEQCNSRLLLLASGIRFGIGTQWLASRSVNAPICATIRAANYTSQHLVYV